MLISFEQRTQRQKCSGHCSGHVQVAARSSQDGNLHQHQLSKVRQIRHLWAVLLRCAQGRQICGLAVWSESRPQRVVWGLPQCQAPREGPWVARLRPSPAKPPLAARAEAVTVAPPLPVESERGHRKRPRSCRRSGPHARPPQSACNTKPRRYAPQSTEARPGCPIGPLSLS